MHRSRNWYDPASRPVRNQEAALVRCGKVSCWPRRKTPVLNVNACTRSGPGDSWELFVRPLARPVAEAATPLFRVRDLLVGAFAQKNDRRPPGGDSGLSLPALLCKSLPKGNRQSSFCRALAEAKAQGGQLAQLFNELVVQSANLARRALFSSFVFFTTGQDLCGGSAASLCCQDHCVARQRCCSLLAGAMPIRCRTCHSSGVGT